MFLIGISGKAGSGKDTAADMILSELGKKNLICEKYSMATPLKTVAKFVFGLTEEEVSTQEGKKSFNPNCYGKSNREILQLLGTEAFRDVFDSEVWVDYADRYTRTATQNISPTNSIKQWEDYGCTPMVTKNVEVFVIPDIRFKNEADWVKKNGVLLQINRPGLVSITEGGHSSESLIGIDPDFILNNEGDIEALDKIIVDGLDAIISFKREVD